MGVSCNFSLKPANWTKHRNPGFAKGQLWWERQQLHCLRASEKLAMLTWHALWVSVSPWNTKPAGDCTTVLHFFAIAISFALHVHTSCYIMDHYELLFWLFTLPVLLQTTSDYFRLLQTTSDYFDDPTTWTSVYNVVPRQNEFDDKGIRVPREWNFRFLKIALASTKDTHVLIYNMSWQFLVGVAGNVSFRFLQLYYVSVILWQ